MNISCCCNDSDSLPPGWTCEDVEIVPCQIYVANFIGEAVPDVQPFKSISIQKTECCELTVLLDGQIFTMPSCTYSHTLQFDCDVTTLELVGDCLDTTNVTVMNSIPAVIERVCTYVNPNPDGPSLYDLARFPCKYANCP